MKRHKLLNVYFACSVLAVFGVATAPGPASKWLSAALAVACIMALRLWAEEEP